MKITVEPEEELQQIASELLFTLAKLRYWTKKWNEHYGAYYKDQKFNWEKKSDELLEKYKLKEIELQAQRKDVQVIKKQSNEE
jgi:hypothetical protein